MLVRSGTLVAAPVPIPNYSFESPTTSFVSLLIDSWEKTPKPDWYVEDGGFLWTQLIGSFKNTATNSPNHIWNCDGSQAIWLFAVPEVGLSQEYQETDLNDPAPPALDALFEPGKSYELTVGLFGGGAGGNYGMLPGVTLELSLYYRDAASNRVTVAATTVTNSADLFTSNTNLVDFTVQTPVVQSSDPWAGRHVGIMILSTVSTNLQGGYWDLDNVRLKSIQEPALTQPTLSNNRIEFTLLSEPGAVLEVLAGDNLALPVANWPVIQTLTNESGTVSFGDHATGQQRFYQFRQPP